MEHTAIFTELARKVEETMIPGYDSVILRQLERDIIAAFAGDSGLDNYEFCLRYAGAFGFWQGKRHAHPRWYLKFIDAAVLLLPKDCIWGLEPSEDRAVWAAGPKGKPKVRVPFGGTAPFETAQELIPAALTVAILRVQAQLPLPVWEAELGKIRKMAENRPKTDKNSENIAKMGQKEKKKRLKLEKKPKNPENRKKLALKRRK